MLSFFCNPCWIDLYFWKGFKPDETSSLIYGDFERFANDGNSAIPLDLAVKNTGYSENEDSKSAVPALTHGHLENWQPLSLL